MVVWFGIFTSKEADWVNVISFITQSVSGIGIRIFAYTMSLSCAQVVPRNMGIENKENGHVSWVCNL